MALIARQQILVQNIALETFRLTSTDSAEDSEALRQEIVDQTRDIEKLHKHLMEEFKKPPHLFWKLLDSKIIGINDIELYVGLSSSIHDFISDSDKISSIKSNLSLQECLVFIQKSEKLVQNLNGLHDSYRAKRKQKVTAYKNIEMLSYASILSLLILSGLFVFRPISNHVRSTRTELEKARKQAEQANQIKTDFLTNISHEIRTPLGSVIGFADILLCDSSCEGSQRDLVLSLKRSAIHLKTLIDDILDLAKVESGTIEIEEDDLNLVHLLHEIKSIVGVKMNEKNLDFSIQFQSEIPEYIHSDRIRLVQILVNLLGNAAKFTHKGQVTLRVSASKISDSDLSEIVFTIIDTGIGIPTEKRKKIFKRFIQLESTLSRKTSGTGLGLALSKRLAELINGELFLLKSKLGSGSTFRFILRCPVPKGTKLISRYVKSTSEEEESLDIEKIAGSLEGINILLVEDGEDNQRIFNYFLKLAGAHVHACWDGLAGLDYASQYDDVDVILMDIQLPKMDGYTVTKELLSRGIQKPIIALTAHAMRQERDRCLNSGFTDYLSKPVTIPSLIRTIKKHASVNSVAHGNTEQALKSKYHDNELYKPMIQEFLASLPERINDIKDHATKNDWNSVTKEAHKFKGAASTYGYPSLTSVAAEIETQASASQVSPEDIQTLIEEFEKLCTSAKKNAPL